MSNNTKKQKEHQIRLETFIDNMFYKEDLADYVYTDDKNIIAKRVMELRKYIEILDINENLKKNILNNNEFLEILSHFDIITLFNQYNDETVVDRIYELATDYDYINDFFKDKDAFMILNLYGVVDKDNTGCYKLNDNIVNKLIRENDFYIKDTKSISNIISDNWENQKEIITPDKLDEYSQKRNGINFKYFLFCEEFIKTGKITEVSKKLGIGRRTCYDYLRKEEVKQYLQERQKEIKEENTNLMKQHFNQCFNELYNMSVGQYIKDNVKIKAIDTFLKHYENSILKPNNTVE